MQKTLDEAQSDFLIMVADMIRELHMKTKDLRYINDNMQCTLATLSRIESKLELIEQKLIKLTEEKIEDWNGGIG